ncbi:hypothetical protein GJU41_12835 [Bacillus idriensis]|uniref:Uncharacterized protein n=1 Tax=Metabacillus idriensis TaxID=324768 RepID=A0A6I2MEK1_9BACI|nr:hypothetical protein [Metabacillus idriensis]MRX54861.1 hypothetical protein [Metabacillus idriensis]
MNISFSSPGSIWGIDIPLIKTVESVKASLVSITTPMSSALTSGLWESFSSIQTRISILDKLFLFKNYSEVFSFLSNHSFLIPIIFEAYGEIENVFPDNIGLSLEIIEDIDNGEEKLFLKISSLSNNSYQLLDILDDNWWLDTMPKANFKMNIDLEY